MERRYLDMANSAAARGLTDPQIAALFGETDRGIKYRDAHKAIRVVRAKRQAIEDIVIWTMSVYHDYSPRRIQDWGRQWVPSFPSRHYCSSA